MRTIRQQLTRKLLLGFALPLILGELGVFLLMREELVEQFDAVLRAKAQAIATVTRQSRDGLRVETSDRFMREFDDDAGRDADRNRGDDEARAPVAPAFFEMWTSDGRPIQRSESLGRLDLPFPGPRREAGFWNMALPSGGAGRAVAFVFRPLGPRESRTAAPPSPVVLVVASGRRDLDHTLAMLAALLSGCGLLLLGATSVVVPRVLRRELAPLDALAGQAARIDADTLSARFPTEGLPSELLPISQRLNDLLSRLEQSFERERQFSGDLAHELRTPIAELRSIAELALKWPESRDAATDRDALQIAIQMEGIVTRLLELLRSERGQLSIAPEAVPLDATLKSVWRTFADRAAARRVEVTWDVPDGAVVETSPVILRSILANLIENAVDYTPEGGAVSIHASVDAPRFEVRVSNSVEHLKPDDLPKLFDRLWRRDPARSGGGHSGLGLSIARAFAQALGCELTARFEEDGRLTFALARG